MPNRSESLKSISGRGKQYLETARTLLRAAQTMTDRAIAGQLKALADDYQRRAEKASHVDAAKASARSAAGAGAMYGSVFPPADPESEQDEAPASHTVNGANALRSDGALS
jgi:hypothetical protein